MSDDLIVMQRQLADTPSTTKHPQLIERKIGFVEKCWIEKEPDGEMFMMAFHLVGGKITTFRLDRGMLDPIMAALTRTKASMAANDNAPRH